MALAALYLTVVRVIHIFAAVIWVGGGIFFVSVLAPTVQQAGPDGGRFMLHFARAGRFARLLTINSILTVLSGALLYWQQFRFDVRLILTPSGIAFTLGAIVGIMAFLDSAFHTGRVATELAAVAHEILEGKGAPPPDLLQKAQAVGAKMASASLVSVILASVALFFMAVARYL
jgi:uncharacterized membrane protein